MPCLTIKEAADKCGIGANNIHTYIGRGKIVKRRDGLIDDTHPLNISFFSKYDSSYIKEIPKIIEKPIKIEIQKQEIIELEKVKDKQIITVKKTKNT
jgi:hypothetical protein